MNAPALLLLGIGLIGLAGCTIVTSQVLPPMPSGWRTRLSWRRRRTGPVEPSGAARRVVTGPPAAARLASDSRPARRAAFRPDVLRRERELLSIAESRRAIEQLADDDPERLASVVGLLLAQDGFDDPTSERQP